MRIVKTSPKQSAEWHYRTGMLGVVAIIGLYNSLFAFSFLPLTEGWFSVYAHLILDGKMPYRDFYLYLTPLYPMLMAAIIGLLGDSFLMLRLLGVLIVVAIAVLLYLVLARSFRPSSSMIASIVAIIYYQSGVAHISYDFTQVLTLFTLAATWALVMASDTGEDEALAIETLSWNRPVIRRVMLAGLFATLAFLTKQSNGAFVVVSAWLGCAYIAAPYRQDGWRLILAFGIGCLVPLTVILVWLFHANSLQAFIGQIFGDALAAKGSLSVVLFSWLRDMLSLVYLMKVITACSLMALVLLCSFILGKLLADSARPLVRTGREKFLLITYGLLCLIAIATTYLTDFSSLAYQIGLQASNYIISTTTTLSALVLTLAAIGFSIPAIRAFLSPPTVVIGIMSAGMIWGNGTSGGLSEISVFTMFALVLVGMLDLSQFRYVGPTLAVVLATCFICFFSSNKFDAPYSWWSIEEPSVYQAGHSSNAALARGLKMSKNTATNLDELTSSLATGPQDGDIFAFPNIPIVYLLSNRWPNSKVIVPWFDFLSDEHAKKEGSRLLEVPPAIIVNLKLPPLVWSEHERLFRNRKSLGQRDIQSAISELTRNHKAYRLEMSREISPNCWLEVWHRVADNKL